MLLKLGSEGEDVKKLQVKLGVDPIGKKTYKDINPTPTDRKVMEMLKKNSKLSIFSSTNKSKYKRNLLSEENIITD